MKLFSLERWLPHWQLLAWPVFALVLALPISVYVVTEQITSNHAAVVIAVVIIVLSYLYPLGRFYELRVLVNMTSAETVLLRRQVYRLARGCRRHQSSGFTIPIDRRVVCVDRDRTSKCVFVTRTLELPKLAADTSCRIWVKSTTYFIWKGTAISCWHGVLTPVDIVQGRVNPRPWKVLNVLLEAPGRPTGRRQSTRALSAPELKTLSRLLQRYLDADAKSPLPRQ